MEVRGQFVEIRAFSFHGVGPRDRAHIISLGSKCPDALSYLNSLVSPSEWYIKQTYIFQSMGVLSSSSYNQVDHLVHPTLDTGFKRQESAA